MIDETLWLLFIVYCGTAVILWAGSSSCRKKKRLISLPSPPLLRLVQGEQATALKSLGVRLA